MLSAYIFSSFLSKFADEIYNAELLLFFKFRWDFLNLKGMVFNLDKSD